MSIKSEYTILNNEKARTEKIFKYNTLAILAILPLAQVSKELCQHYHERQNHFIDKTKTKKHKVYLKHVVEYLRNVLTKESCLSNNNRFSLYLNPFSHPISKVYLTDVYSKLERGVKFPEGDRKQGNLAT